MTLGQSDDKILLSLLYHAIISFKKKWQKLWAEKDL